MELIGTLDGWLLRNRLLLLCFILGVVAVTLEEAELLPMAPLLFSLLLSTQLLLLLLLLLSTQLLLLLLLLQLWLPRMLVGGGHVSIRGVAQHTHRVAPSHHTRLSLPLPLLCPYFTAMKPGAVSMGVWRSASAASLASFRRWAFLALAWL